MQRRLRHRLIASPFQSIADATGDRETAAAGRQADLSHRRALASERPGCGTTTMRYETPGVGGAGSLSAARGTVWRRAASHAVEASRRVEGVILGKFQ